MEHPYDSRLSGSNTPKKASKWIDWRWAIAFIFYIATLVIISVLAYHNQLPKSLTANDKLGHFVLFGFAGFLSHQALRQRRFHFYGLPLPIGPLGIGLLVIIDEGLQALSPNRSAGIDDLWANWFGILVFLWIGNWVIAKLPSTSRPKPPPSS